MGYWKGGKGAGAQSWGEKGERGDELGRRKEVWDLEDLSRAHRRNWDDVIQAMAFFCWEWGVLYTI